MSHFVLMTSLFREVEKYKTQAEPHLPARQLSGSYVIPSSPALPPMGEGSLPPFVGEGPGVRGTATQGLVNASLCAVTTKRVLPQTERGFEEKVAFDRLYGSWAE